MKNKVISLVFLFVGTLLGAQSEYFTQTFDYHKINTKSFTLNTGENNQQKFLWSSVNTCLQLADLAENGGWNETRIIGSVPNNIKIRAQKLSYTPFDVQWGDETFELRMILVRPDDQAQRPCVLLSPGGGGDLNNWYNYLALGVADYVSRGYAVAFYENFNNRYVMEAAAAFPAAETNLPVVPNDESAFYALYQFARAAAHFVAGHADEWNVRPHQLFAGGNSAGGFSAYALTLADENNFTHPTFDALGSKTDKVDPAFVNSPYSILGMGILGSGMFRPDALMGDLIDPDDQLSCAVIWHGGQDASIHLGCCESTPCNNENNLEICGAVEVGDRLCAAGIAHEVRVNCEGGHIVIASLLNTGQINNDPTWAMMIGPLYREVQQMMDIQQAIALRFSQAINQVSMTNCSQISVKPKNFPNPTGANWHLVNGPDCTQTAGRLADPRNQTKSERRLGAVLFPNPTSGEFIIEWESINKQSFHLELYDALGQRLLARDFEGEEGTIRYSIDELAAWPAGAYRWILTSDESGQDGIVVKK